MKKYLMTGIAALALSAGFTSCSHDIEPMTQEEINQIETQKIVQTYNQAFLKYVGGGPIASNQTWGFGAANARTRSVEYLNTLAAGSNKNRNQWAAYDDVYSLVVPTPLSEGQKLRVKAYFQSHPFLTYEVPDMTNYFVQQVYTGHSSAGPLSDEEYTSGNNVTVVGSEHMDKLTINGQHVFDFNGANNVNTATDVLNNGEDKNSKNFHSDQITLMCGTKPTYVGYETSEASILKNDCCALVGAKAIDDWANDPANYVDGKAIGENVWYGKDEAGYDNSYWERSFVGLDYEQLKPDQCFTTKNNSEYVYRKDFMSKSMNWILYQGQMVAASTLSNDQLFFPNGEPVRWVIDNTNEFLGENLGTNQNTFNKQGTKEWFKNTFNVDITNGSEDYYDLDAVLACVNQGAYPKMNNMEFIKGLGGRDYVFTDWIVTLAPAKDYTRTDGGDDNPGGGTTSNADLRIMAEDLSASDDTDFDFNDIVFDVYYAKAGETTTKIVVQAAGGTLPLRIKTGEGTWQEVHALYNQGTGIMINTGAETKYPGKGKDNLGTKEVTLNYAVTSEEAAKGIIIEVEKNGQWIEMKAERGEPAAKFAVPATVDWCSERTSIKEKNEKFVDWATRNASIKWW